MPGRRHRLPGSSLAWFEEHGVIVEPVMTDDGSAYDSRIFAAALKHHGIAHKRTRPSTPKTNGYATPLDISADRQAAMHPWLRDDNTPGPHSVLAGKPLISRLTRDNLLDRDIQRGLALALPPCSAGDDAGAGRAAG